MPAEAAAASKKKKKLKKRVGWKVSQKGRTCFLFKAPGGGPGPASPTPHTHTPHKSICPSKTSPPLFFFFFFLLLPRNSSGMRDKSDENRVKATFLNGSSIFREATSPFDRRRRRFVGFFFLFLWETFLRGWNRWGSHNVRQWLFVVYWPGSS